MLVRSAGWGAATHKFFDASDIGTGTAMVFLLVVAIVGELLTFGLVAPFYGLLPALWAAPVGGALGALMAGMFVSRRT